MNSHEASVYVDPQSAGAAMAAVGLIILFIIVIALIIYVYLSISYMKIAKKTGTENAWLAWVPIADFYLLTQVAKKPGWWVILYLVPIANIIVSVLVWMSIAKTLKKPDWLGILMIVPMANLIVPGYLAFSKAEETLTLATSEVPPTTPVAQ